MVTTPQSIAEALDRLAARDDDIARTLAEVGYPEPRVREPGFATLLNIIVGQQASVQSATAIRERLLAAADPLTPASFLALDDAAVLEQIVARKGLGRWSAEIYMLFALGRADIWPADDLAVRIAVHHLKGLDERPDRATMNRLAEPWRPYRGVVALLMWHVYRKAAL